MKTKKQYGFFHANETKKPKDKMITFRVELGKTGHLWQIAENKARKMADIKGLTLAGGASVPAEYDDYKNDYVIDVPFNTAQKEEPKARLPKNILEWDESEIPQDEFFNENDYWNQFLEELTEVMTKKDVRKNGYWLIEGSNMGWMKRSGYKYAQADTSIELLKALLPDTNDFKIRVRNDRKNIRGLIFIVSHHDAPMGEVYRVRPCSEKDYENNQ